MSKLHVMLDFETLDNKPTAVVASLGAVFFTRERGRIHEAEYHFDMTAQKTRTIGPDTVKWWLEREKDAVQKTFIKDAHLKLPDFCLDFYLQTKTAFEIMQEEFGPRKTFIWGNGSDFDCSIMTDIYKTEHPQGPFWAFWNSRCFRTLNDLTGCKDLVKRPGTHHSAIDDARYQADCVIASGSLK